MTRDELQSVLQQPYERDRWLEMLRHVLPGAAVFASPQPVATADTGAQSIAHLARVTLDGGKQLAVLEIRVAERIALLRNRVGLRNLIARFIDQAEFHGVLGIFLSAESDYRFTFASRVSEFDTQGNLTQQETAPRRYTYILGPNESCRTAAERFAQLAGKADAATLTDVVEAFSVEKLNKEFFADFCRAFDRVSKDIRQHHAKWSDTDVEREAQTLLDRLLFLYFVQRKGWLNRQRGYLIGHFREHHDARPKGTSYLDQFLRPLFVKLSTEGPVADIAGHNLPFLNGGLFNDEYGDEQNDDTARRHNELTVGNDTFHFVFENLLERYNFTIHEDSPTNQEVAIDPEMLGKIFEALVLQIEHSTTGGKSLRHDTGSHYTPRPIVHYLCVGALAAWLENQPPFGVPPSGGQGLDGADGEPAKAGTPNARQRIAKLLSLDASEGLDDDARKTLDQCFTPDEAAALLDRLATLRACDPAVGSGAFPMGLLRELLNLARLCETRARGQDPVDGDRTWLYETKKRIIERVIYGVDIQERAIEISKLRLWLSLMVDHDLGVDPLNCDARSFRRALADLEPLPNLDFKIRRADSLVDKIHGQPVVLSSLSRETGAALPLSRLTTAKREFFAARTAAAKRKLRFAIYASLTELAKIELTRARTDAAGLGLMMDDASAARVAELDHGLKEITFIAAQVRDARKLRAAAQDESLERIRARFDDPQKPTFVWQLDFAEVFHRFGVPASAGSAQEENGALGLSDAAPPEGGTPNGGFDIVLANPPYVRMELIKQLKPMLRQCYPHVHDERTDLYVYFYARAQELLRPGGIGAFISSNKWLRAGYGEKLRRFLLDEQEFRLVVDFGELPVFEAAATFPAIFVWRKQPRASSPTTWAVVRDLAACYVEGIGNLVAREGHVLPATQFGKGKARLAAVSAAGIRSKMEASGPRLAVLVSGRICWGVKTGFNEAFVIDRETRDRLVAEDKSSEEVIKPLLTGDDVRRYEAHFRSEFLIYMPHGVRIRRYPAVERHLRPFRAQLERRATQQEWFELQQPQEAYVPFLEATKLIYPEIGKESRFVLEPDGFYLNNKTFFLPTDDWYLLGVLNSASVFDYLKGTCSVLGDEADGGRLEFRAQYMETLPIPNAPESERAAVAKLAKEAQRLHGQRRARVEKFLREVGLEPAQSTSRNPLEQPWSLAPEEFTRRAPRPDVKQFTPARDETAALTAQVAKIEAEIDARVAALYGL